MDVADVCASTHGNVFGFVVEPSKIPIVSSVFTEETFALRRVNCNAEAEVKVFMKIIYWYIVFDLIVLVRHDIFCYSGDEERL